MTEFKPSAGLLLEWDASVNGRVFLRENETLKKLLVGYAHSMFWEYVKKRIKDYEI